MGNIVATESKNADRLSRLSEGQVDCLKLVANFHSSKQIARKLNISPHTVDQRLKRAQSILHVNSRFDAARMLSSSPDFICGDLVYQSPDVPDDDEISSNEFAPSGENSQGAIGSRELHQSQTLYDASFGGFRQNTNFPFVLFDTSSENNLSVSARVGVIMALLLLTIFALGALVSVTEGISRLV